ncbi:hypothetical protein C8J57DRAFT_1722865 [Mycena rebaudengoi]|nr:hypothetical protein C8J57DRAFT_1722865 [Mycena rebaudengoi]
MEASMALSYQETRRTAVRLRVERGRQTCSGQDFSPYDFPNQSNKPIEVIQLDISIATLLKDAITDADLLVLIRDERIQSAGLATFAPKMYHYLVDNAPPLVQQDPTLEKKLRQFHLSCGNCNRALHDAYDGVPGARWEWPFACTQNMMNLPAITLKFLGLHMLRRWALKAMHHQMASPKKARSSFDPAGKRMKQEIMGRTRRHIALSPTQTKWLGQFTPPPQTPRHPDGSYAKRKIARLKARRPPSSIWSLCEMRQGGQECRPLLFLGRRRQWKSRAQREERQHEQQEEAEREAARRELRRIRDERVAA